MQSRCFEGSVLQMEQCELRSISFAQGHDSGLLTGVFKADEGEVSE